MNLRLSILGLLWMGAAGCGSTPEAPGGPSTTSIEEAGAVSGAASGAASGSSSEGSGAASGESSGAASGSSSEASTGSSAGDDSGEAPEASSGSEISSGSSSAGSSSGGEGDDGGVSAPDTGLGTPVDGGPAFTGTTISGTVKVTPGMSVGHVPPAFLGFSFEKTHMTDNFFTGTNAPLIALFKLLGPGVVRIGANDVDRTTWQASAMPVSGQPFPHVVGTVEVDGLAAFLQATGWKVIYGLNYKTGTAANDAAEAMYAAGKLGASLSAFEIGNEIDRGPPTYTPAAWQAFATAVKAAAPNSLFAGPATDPSATAFAATFAKDHAGELALVTHHYYGRGARTMAAMLAPDPQLPTILDAVAAAASSNHVPQGFRLGECNSFNGHGVAGVSDALASALWSLDFFFINAMHGSAGINFHGGQVGMDGTTPFLYSPIAETSSGITGVNPIFYGMLLMSLVGSGDVLETTATAGSLNFTGYTLARADGSRSVVLVNKDASTGVTASVDMGGPVASASAIYLRGASLTATSGVTLAGAGVTAAGAWKPNPPYALSSAGNVVTLVVPPASAALVDVP